MIIISSCLSTKLTEIKYSLNLSICSINFFYCLLINKPTPEPFFLSLFELDQKLLYLDCSLFIHIPSVCVILVSATPKMSIALSDAHSSRNSTLWILLLIPLILCVATLISVFLSIQSLLELFILLRLSSQMVNCLCATFFPFLSFVFSGRQRIIFSKAISSDILVCPKSLSILL